MLFKLDPSTIRSLVLQGHLHHRWLLALSSADELPNPVDSGSASDSSLFSAGDFGDGQPVYFTRPPEGRMTHDTVRESLTRQFGVPALGGLPQQGVVPSHCATDYQIVGGFTVLVVTVSHLWHDVRHRRSEFVDVLASYSTPSKPTTWMMTIAYTPLSVVPVFTRKSPVTPGTSHVSITVVIVSKTHRNA